LVQTAGLLRNPYTVGVRIIVVNDNRQVLLVRHSYLKGWYLPGGGVDKGEIMSEAVRRELLEEAGIAAKGNPKLLGVFLNRKGLGRDHIGLFEVTDWAPSETYLQSNTEIADARFYSADDLPDGTTRATSARIREYVGAGGDTGSKTGEW